MNLSTLSDIDPETGHTWDLGAAGIGFEPEHILVEFLYSFELRRFRVYSDGMVVDFEYADAHRRSPDQQKWLNHVSRFQGCPGNLTIEVGSRVGRRFGGSLILAQREPAKELADSRLVGVKLTLPDNQGISAVDPKLTSGRAFLRNGRVETRSPILMTKMCALLGGVPLMLGSRIGLEIRQPRYAIVGGLLVSQLLTLFTTPVVYIYMDRLRHWLWHRCSADRTPSGAEASAAH